MSKVAIEGNASGSGTFTIASPNSNTNRTLTLPDSTGTVVVSGTTPSLNGITFPATQVASAGANTLDDYEEGTFTPILADNVSVSNAATMTTQEGFYTKVGNTVNIQMQIIWSAKGTMGAGNNVRIFGLPFAAKSNTGGYYWPAASTMTSGSSDFIAGMEGGQTRIVFTAVNAPTSELGTTIVSSSGRLLIQYTYQV
jgi:hypothetical protein